MNEHANSPTFSALNKCNSVTDLYPVNCPPLLFNNAYVFPRYQFLNELYPIRFSFSVSKMSPRPSLVPEPDGQWSEGSQPQNNNNNNNNGSSGPKAGANQEPGKPPSRAGACRVCLKAFKPDDFSKTCFECQHRVCDDCASYSKPDENEDMVSVLPP